MKAIITGATGFLGSHLVSLLKEKNWKIVAIGRNDKIGKALASKDIVYRNCDITNYEKINEVIEEADVIFHCAALSSAWGNYEDFHLTNVEGTRNVLQAAIEKRIKRIIYVSSTSVYFNYENKENIKESTCLNHSPANSYSKSKLLGERVILNENRDLIETIVMRPRGIIGEGDTSIMPRILRIAEKGWFPLIGGGNAMLDVTYVKNVAHGLYLAAIADNCNGEIFNISNDEPVMIKELLKATFLKTGMRVKLVPVPYFLMKYLAILMEFISLVISGKEPPLTKYGVGLISKTQTLNIDKAKNILGYKPLYSLNDAIEAYADSKKYKAEFV